MGQWQDFLDWLVPSATFRHSKTKNRDLALVRSLTLFVYLGILAFVVYTLIYIVIEGRIEVVRSSIKLDSVEVPSIAVCPFMPNANITKPTNGDPWMVASLVFVNKTTGNPDTEVLTSKPFDCANLKNNNRGCICMDLGDHKFYDHTTRWAQTATSGLLPAGHMETLFRDRLEVTTNVKDPSGEDTLEIGLYTKNDRLPDWFYVGQGEYTIGNLELATWTATDISPTGLRKTLAGDFVAMAKYRLMFTFNGFQVGRRGLHRPVDQTKISYEMKNFFVDETVSSEKAQSIYGLLILVCLLLAKGAIHSIFMEVVMPVADPDKDKIQERELSAGSEWLAYLCCCCCYQSPPDDAARVEASEKQPLLK